MPDITISVTASQAQRIAAALGPKPAELTQEEWVVKHLKNWIKSRVKVAEAEAASNTAHDVAMAQAETDFGGF
jgi:hypothetical protein